MQNSARSECTSSLLEISLSIPRFCREIIQRCLSFECRFEPMKLALMIKPKGNSSRAVRARSRILFGETRNETRYRPRTEASIHPSIDSSALMYDEKKDHKKRSRINHKVSLLFHRRANRTEQVPVLASARRIGDRGRERGRGGDQ